MSERHIRWVLAALIVGQLLLLTAQVGEPGGSSTYLESAVMRVMAPLAGLVEAVADGVRGVSSGVRLNRTLIDENRRLRAEVEKLRERSIRHFGLEAELRRLSEALEYERRDNEAILPADIVYIDHASWLQTAILVLESGRAKLNQPVVSSEGLVGRLVLVSGAYAKLQLITDRSASVGVMLERTRRQGVVRGSGHGSLELDYVPLQADVQVGDRLVTAGIDGIYPRGIPVGTVAAVTAGDELFHSIRVIPRVDFGVLDQVFVLDRDALPPEMREDLQDASP